MRDPYENIRPEDVDKSEIILTNEQQAAYNEMMEKYSSKKGGVSLLYGITGSGKTQVFLKLIDEVSSQGPRRDINGSGDFADAAGAFNISPPIRAKGRCFSQRHVAWPAHGRMEAD